MSQRDVFCGSEQIAVRRWLRPAVEIEVGAMLPFMVEKEHAQFVRDHESDPFVLRTGDDGGWALEIVSVESTGTEGVWVSAKAVSRISRRANSPTPTPSRELRGTLQGIPVPGVDE